MWGIECEGQLYYNHLCVLLRKDHGAMLA